uniref:Protein kinase domain-containing protein n=1 Tax=Hippocampus comes TaxID=109280 RepID=A0A3Q2Y507_HIPCM
IFEGSQRLDRQPSKAQHSDAKNLHHRFAIAEELGRGQFGIVHRCVSISSEKTYMAKFVKVREILPGPGGFSFHHLTVSNSTQLVRFLA